jgi:precorrin-6B methylase 2
MKKQVPAIISGFILALSLAVPVAAQQTQEYQPSVGQEGKDVVWVPTPDELVTAMLDMAKLTPTDTLIDLGSGDGRIVIAAAKRGARATGYEYNPDMVELSRANAAKAGLAGKAEFVQADIFQTDFTRATVLTMYLLPELNIKLRSKILDMKPGTRIVSHAFSMEDWEADDTLEQEGRTAYLWIVPAKVAGIWSWPGESGDAQLSLNQTYQKIAGTLKVGGRDLPIRDAKLDGDRIYFSVNEGNPTTVQYSGRVRGNSIEGTVKAPSKAETKWMAKKASAPAP